MIIIEGCDGTGKTTLANVILHRAKRRGLILNYIKEGPPKNGLQYYINRVKQENRHQLCDRFHLGECVYPVVMQDGRRGLADHEQYMIEMALLSSGSVMVAASAPVEFINNVFQSRGELFVSHHHIPMIKDLFDQCFKRSLLPIVSYDPTKHNVDDVADKVLNLYEDKVLQIKPVYKFNSVGGRPLLGKTVMIVGDRTNPFKPDVADGRQLAFTSHRGCSLYLHKALAHARENHYYLTNSIKSGDKKSDINSLLSEVWLIKPNKIVAMGEVAARYLSRIHVEFEHTYHPQYWCRFKAGFINELIMQLK